MANLRSSTKDIRRIARRTIRNRQAVSRLRTLKKAVQTAVTAGQTEAAQKAAVAYVSAMDKAAKTGVVHKNAADRAKSSLAPLLLKSAAKAA